MAAKPHRISGCENDGRKADVVFVHGLGGDAFETWRHGKDDASSWPHRLGEEFPDVGVWSFGYAASPSRWTRYLPAFLKPSRDQGHGMALPARGKQALDQMGLEGLGERPLMFICHSLGGLVVKEILRASDDEDARREIRDNTRAVLFLATPHMGSDLASRLSSFRWRWVFGATVTLQDLRAHDAHLESLFNWYINNSKGVQTASYYETRKCRGVMVVKPAFARAGVGPDPIPLGENHISIAKPRESVAQVCLKVNKLIRDYVLTRTVADKVEDLQNLLDALETAGAESVTGPRMRELLESVLKESKDLKDENERLKSRDAERLELRARVDAVQRLLSDRDAP